MRSDRDGANPRRDECRGELLDSSSFAGGWRSRAGGLEMGMNKMPEKTKELDQALTAFLTEVKATTVQTKIGKDE